MMPRPAGRSLKLGCLAAALLAPTLGAQAPAPPTPEPAGTVSDLVPRVRLTRARVKSDVQLRDPVLLRDLLETQKKARARLELRDGSIVNLGPRSRFAVVEVSETTQQAGMVLLQGRLRAEVAKRTRPNGRFVVRTRTAVVGVVGTVPFVAAFPEETIVANLSDDPGSLVWVRSSDPRLDVVVIVKPGYGTRVPLGHPPTTPRVWDRKEIERARNDNREFGRYDANFARDYPDGFPYAADDYDREADYNDAYGSYFGRGQYGDDRDDDNSGHGSGNSGRGSGSSGSGSGRPR